MIPDSTVRRYTYKSGAVYEGSFDGTKRHGRGYWQHPDGEAYEGEYRDNKQEGLGVYDFTASGKRYVGHWRAGEMDGEGVYYFTPDYSTYYLGSYASDKKHGNGFYCYDNGIVTAQEWDNGSLLNEKEATATQCVQCAQQIERIFADASCLAPHLLGEVISASEVRTFQFPSGATYTGQYNGTKKHGTGYWAHPEGDSYDGQFEHNKHCGWGVYVIGRSGKKYVGRWRDGKMNGVGVYYFNAQETEFFVGSYKDDVKHGRGLYHFADSDCNKVQLWESGQLREERNASEEDIEEYSEAAQLIVDIVRPYAPRYNPIAYK